MKLYSEGTNFKLYQGNMLDMLNVIDKNSIDCIITDPPYELNFMSKKWDNNGISFRIETWSKCFEVLKPGGYLLAFGGTRTYHRIACAIEDAGFEIRDCIMWLYGSGFPKSIDVSKQIDKNNAKSRTVPNEFKDYLNEKRKQKGYSLADINKLMETPTTGGGFASSLMGEKKDLILPTKENYNKLKQILDLDNRYDELVDIYKVDREIIDSKETNLTVYQNIGDKNVSGKINITAPTTKLAKKWQGWGSCLKPAYEPIIVARKPFKGSLVDNIINNGIGGLNIDECRIDTNGELIDNHKTKGIPFMRNAENYEELERSKTTQGRFPANIIHDSLTEKWSRYFYCAKASKKDRDEGLDNRNSHPTVKPTELMQYLIRLIAPKGAIILDPFMGSGSTGKAVMYENKERNVNYKFIGIDITEEYLPTSDARIRYINEKKEKYKEFTIEDFIEV